MKRLGVFLLPHGWDASPSQGYPHGYPFIHLDTMRVNCLAQEHNAVPRPGLEPGPYDPESSALTIRPPHLPTEAGIKLFTKVQEHTNMKKETSRLKTIQVPFLAKWTKGEIFKKFQPPSCKSLRIKVAGTSFLARKVGSLSCGGARLFSHKVSFVLFQTKFVYIQDYIHKYDLS